MPWNEKVIKGFLFVILLAQLGYLFFKQDFVRSAEFHSHSPKYEINEAPFFRAEFLWHEALTTEVHSATLAKLSNGSVISIWYGGSREGAKDVALYASHYTHAEKKWSKPFVVIERNEVSQQLGRYVKKIGNPTIIRDEQGRLVLFFVTSIAGWSLSSINMMFSADDGLTWSKVRRLTTSPFMNISTLVKSKPVLMKNGQIALPIYHELFGKFSEILYLDAEGKVLDKQRLTAGRNHIQPQIIPLSDEDALVFHRNVNKINRKIHSQKTINGGLHWSKSTQTPLPNPDAAISGIALSVDDFLLVYNDDEEYRSNLAVTKYDGKQTMWQQPHYIEGSPLQRNEDILEVSYPTLIVDDFGYFHLVYTWKKKRIKHVVFNRAWLEQQQSVVE